MFKCEPGGAAIHARHEFDLSNSHGQIRLPTPPKKRRKLRPRSPQIIFSVDWRIVLACLVLIGCDRPIPTSLDDMPVATRDLPSATSAMRKRADVPGKLQHQHGRRHRDCAQGSNVDLFGRHAVQHQCAGFVCFGDGHRRRNLRALRLRQSSSRGRRLRAVSRAHVLRVHRVQRPASARRLHLRLRRRFRKCTVNTTRRRNSSVANPRNNGVNYNQLPITLNADSK